MLRTIKTGWVVLSLCSVLGGCATLLGGDTQKELSGRDRAILFVQMAQGALLEGDPTGALQNLAEAEKWDAELASLHYFRSLAYFAKRDSKAALKSVEKAVQLDSAHSEYANTYGKLLMDAGRYAEARKPLTQAASDPLYRDAYKAYTNLGILNYRQGRHEEARRSFDQAVLADAQNSCVAYYYRGNLWMRESEFKKAVTDYERAVDKYCANFKEAHFALGLVYARSQKFGLARKKFMEIRSLFPNTEIASKSLEQLEYLP